jgi:hypothetical protein
MPPAQAEQFLPVGSRLAMGYYYPSLTIISNPTDIQVSLNFWIQELTSSYGLDHVYSVLYKDIDKMHQDFIDRKLDLIIAPPILIATKFDRKLLADGFLGVQSVDQLNNLSIIVRHDSHSPFDGYLGKRLLLPNNDLLAKMFIETEIFKRYHRPIQKVFSQIKKSNKSQRMVLDIFFGKADVAVVYENALKVIFELNPQLSEKIKIIQRFPVKGRNFGFFHKDYPYNEKLRIKIPLFNKRPRAKLILQIFHTSIVEICYVRDLEPFDIFYNEYQALIKQVKK